MGILDRFRRNNKRKLTKVKVNEDFINSYEIEKIKRKDKFYNIITNNTNVDKFINSQISTEYLKYALNKLTNDLSINEDKKNIIVNLINTRINYIENNIYKQHNDKIETYLKELDILKKELSELENELSKRKAYLDSISEIEHYSNSGYLDVYEEVRNVQKKINFKKEEIKSKLRNIQKERDILKSYNSI